MTQVIQYVSWRATDDSGDGLTPATAKKTIRNSTLNLTAGPSLTARSKLFVETGGCYNPLNGLFAIFTGISNIEIGTYGTASDKPIWDALTYENPGSTGWTYVSGGVWKKVFGVFYVRRLWVGSTSVGDRISDRIVGTAKRRATGTNLTGTTADPTEQNILDGINSNNIWFGAGTSLGWALYVYTGTANRNPADYYGGIAFIQADATGVSTAFGSPTGITVQNQTGIYVHDLHFRGNGAVGMRLQGQNSDSRDVTDCYMKDCIVTAPFQSAFKAQLAGQTSPTRRIRNFTVENVYCDYLSHADEQELDTTYNYLSGICDLFSLGDGSMGGLVTGCTAKNSAHFGFVCGSTAMSLAPPVGCRIIGNTVWYDDFATYARGLGAFDPIDCVFSGNLIYGQNVQSQIQGDTKVIGNIWIHLRRGIRKSAVSHAISVQSYIFQVPGGGGLGAAQYIYIQPASVLISNNLFFGSVDSTISFDYFTTLGSNDNTYGAGTVTVQNNIDFGGWQFISTYEDTNKTMTQQVVKNNCVWNGSVGSKQVLYRGTLYDLASAPGFTNHFELDPNLDAEYRAHAPALVAGGAAVSGIDFYRKRLYATPNIGPVNAKSGFERKLLRKLAA